MLMLIAKIKSNRNEIYNISAVKELSGDDDPDVKFFAHKFINSV
jgi:hypothetical protein